MVLGTALLVDKQFLFHDLLLCPSVFVFLFDAAGAATAATSPACDPRKPETEECAVQRSSCDAGRDRACPGRATDRFVVK